MCNNIISIMRSFPPNAIIKIDRRSVFAFQEKNKRYRANNITGKLGCMLQIDGNLFLDQEKKCDNGLLLEDYRFFLIELKGKDVSHACKQLLCTLKKLKSNYSYNFNFFCRIVAKKGIPRIDTHMQSLIKELGSDKKLKTHENEYEENI